MKKFFKLLGVIAIVALIGFSMASCAEQEKEVTETSDGGGTPTGGTGAINPTINIKNNTGYDLWYNYIKPSISTHWSSDLGPIWRDGETKPITLSQPLSVHSKYDIKMTGGGYVFIKYGVTISNNLTITFTVADVNNESNLPTLTIKNRSGKSFNSIKVKPSSSSDWGDSFGSVNNNGDQTITIPIPPSNYTEFDIQMDSSSPTNTYTKTNVTITVGTVLVFTSADKVNPTIELPVIVIDNQTGYDCFYSYIRTPAASTVTEWGSDIGPTYPAGSLVTMSLPYSLATRSAYDIRLTGGGYKFTKYNVNVTDGMILRFSTADIETVTP